MTTIPTGQGGGIAPATPATPVTGQPPAIPVAPVPPQPTPPTELLAGKYKSEEDLNSGITALINKQYATPEAKADYYKSLESGLGGQPTAPQQPQSQTPATTDGLQIQPPPQPDVTSMSPDQIVQAAGLTSEAIGEQFRTNGNLTDDQYAAFAKVSPAYNRLAVDSYLQAQAGQHAFMQSQIDTATSKATEAAGGDTQLTNLRQYAAANLSGKDAAFDALNAQLDSNPAIYAELVQYIKTKHATGMGAGGAQPLVNATLPAQGTGVTAFANNREASTMANDPRMQTDPNFKKVYDARMAMTPDQNFSL